MFPAGASGIALRTAQRESARYCSGSSRGSPQTYEPKLEPGASSATSSSELASSQDAASRQYSGVAKTGRVVAKCPAAAGRLEPSRATTASPITAAGDEVTQRR